MRRLLVAVAVCIAAGGGTASAQYVPEPTPSTTIAESDIGTCHIEGISFSYGEHDVVTGLDVFLRCAETSERTSLHQLHLAGADVAVLGQMLEMVEPPTSGPVTPQ